MPFSTTKTRDAGAAAGTGKRGEAPRILAADDQRDILQALELLLKPEGYEVDSVQSPVLAREALARSTYDAGQSLARQDRRLHGVHFVPFGLQQQLQCLQDVALVIRGQNARSFAALSRPCGSSSVARLGRRKGHV